MFVLVHTCSYFLLLSPTLSRFLSNLLSNFLDLLYPPYLLRPSPTFKDIERVFWMVVSEGRSLPRKSVKPGNKSGEIILVIPSVGTISKFHTPTSTPRTRANATHSTPIPPHPNSRDVSRPHPPPRAPSFGIHSRHLLRPSPETPWPPLHAQWIEAILSEL